MTVDEQKIEFNFPTLCVLVGLTDLLTLLGNMW